MRTIAGSSKGKKAVAAFFCAVLVGLGLLVCAGDSRAFAADAALQGAEIAVDADGASQSDLATVIVQLETPARGLSTQSDDQENRHRVFQDQIAAIAAQAGANGNSESRSGLSTQSGQVDSSNADASVFSVEYDYYHAIDGFAVAVPRAALDDIAALPGVKSAFIARELEVPHDMPSASDDAPSNQDSLDMTHADAVSQRGDGQVIAVIDSGLDVGHEAFGGTLDADALAWTKTEARTRKSACMQGGKDARYISDKIPFAYDYGNDDDDVVPYNAGLSHGTHVTAIAAANAGEVRGTAPNAQIVAMKVANDVSGGIPEAGLIAALDDAAVLQPDVINMSLGSTAGFSQEEAEVYNDALTALEQQGCTICMSAGNSGSSVYRGELFDDKPNASDPDFGTVSSPASYLPAIAVASVDNSQRASCFMAADGTQIGYVDSYFTMGATGALFSQVKDGVYNYVDAKDGSQKTVQRIKAEHPEGFASTIVLVENGTFDDEGNILMSGARAGNVSEILDPAAIVIYASDAGELTAFNAGLATKTPAVCITQADAQLLLAAQDKTITVAQGSTMPASTDYQMSYFSSWGPTPEMTLKPEVTAPGGDIYSAVLKGEYDYKSGTSMASPHLAGISALVRERVAGDAKFSALTARQRAGAVSQLLMSTARPLQDVAGAGDWHSPRRQGAGLVDAQAAVQSDVLVSVEGAADEFRPKAELGSSTQGVWSFTVNLDNKGTVDHVFAPQTVALSELVSDGAFQLASKDYAGNGIDVTYAGDYDATEGTVTVPAGGTASYSVTLRCTDQFAAAVTQARNGTFVDGFAMLKAQDDSSVDLSVPFIGFYGSWGDVPLFDEKADSGVAAHVCASYLANAKDGSVTGCNPLDADAASAIAAGEYAQLDQARTVVSNSGEPGAINELTVHTGLLRNARSLTYDFLDDANAVVASFSYSDIPKSVFSDAAWTTAETHLSSQPRFTGFDDKGRQLPDGRYTVRVKGRAAVEDAQAQTQEYEFFYDTHAPSVSACTFAGDGDAAHVTLSATDASPIAGVSFFDASSGEVIYTVLGDTSNTARDAEGAYSATFDVSVSALQAAWEQAGHTESLPSSIEAYVWDFGMNRASTAQQVDEGFAVEDGVLLSYDGSNTAIVIPDGVREISENAFRGSSVKAVTIPSGVERIGARAFYGAESLKVLTFLDTDESPSALRSIGDEAFAKTSIENVVLPRNLQTLGRGAFSDSGVTRAFVPAQVEELSSQAFARSSIQNVVLASGVRVIGKQAFEGCADLQSVKTGSSFGDAMEGMPSSLEVIADEAFENAGLSRIVLGDAVRSIGSHAFKGAAVTSLEIPDSVVAFGAEALGSCKHLVSVSLGAGVSPSMLKGAFAGSRELRSITVSARNEQCANSDGVVFSKDGEQLLAYPIGRAEPYEVPVGVKTIAPRAFEGASLYRVTFPSSLSSIGAAAFRYARIEGAVALPESFEEVGANAFEGCAFESFDIGGAKVIAEGAFANCAHLTSVNLRSDLCQLESVGANAFGSGTPLVEVVMPDSLTSIGAGAFSNNESLKAMHLGAGAIGDYATLCSGCDNIETLTVSKDNAAYYAEGNVLYSKTDDGMHVVLSLPTNTFESYAVAAGTVQIDKGAFRNNVNLVTLVLPEGLKTIESGAFNGCSALQNVSFPDSLQTVNGFYNTSIQIADFGNNIVSIGKNAFSGHNPNHLVVRGGKQGVYESSSERGDDKQPIKTAYFGEGMVTADFAANKIAPPSVIVVPSSLASLKFAPSSSKLVYDPASITVYAQPGTKGWQAATSALSSIGANPFAQLKEYVPLQCAVVSHDADGQVVSVVANAQGGVVAESGYEYRFVQVTPAMSGGQPVEEVVQDWSGSATVRWNRAAGTSLRCEVRDDTYYSASAIYSMTGDSDDESQADDDALEAARKRAAELAADETAAKNQKVTGKKAVTKTFGAKPFSLAVKSSYKTATFSYTTSNRNVLRVSASGKVTLKAPGKAVVTVRSKAKSLSGKTYVSTFKTVVKVKLAKAKLAKSPKALKAGKLAVSWKRVAGAQGYQLKVGKKTYSIKGGKSLKKTVKVRPGKKVRVQVRAWSKASGKKALGVWSTSRVVKAKK